MLRDLLTVFMLREDEDKRGRGMYPVNMIRKSESRIMDSAATKLGDLGKVTPPAGTSGAFFNCKGRGGTTLSQVSFDIELFFFSPPFKSWKLPQILSSRGEKGGDSLSHL